MSGEYKPFNPKAKYDDIPIEFRREAVDLLIAVKEYWHATDEKTGEPVDPKGFRERAVKLFIAIKEYLRAVGKKTGEPTTEKVVDSEVVEALARQLWNNQKRVSGGRRTRRRRRRARTNRRR